MKLYITLVALAALLPCIWADDQIVQCPDGNICPIGQTCCEKSDHYECCDVQRYRAHRRKYVLGMYSGFGKSIPQASNCSGTLCSEDWCCKYENGSCCSSAHTCCPSDYQCCGGDKLTNIWCCQSKQKCSTDYLYCIAGASPLTSAFAYVIGAFFIALSMKYL